MRGSSIEDRLTAEMLRAILKYCPETGDFFWIKSGKLAGAYNWKGYRTITVNRTIYRAHRLAFLYMTGAWPKYEIDHIDLVKDNNRWKNLREATTSQNAMNRRSVSGVLRGTHFQKSTGKYQAKIYKDGRQIGLGNFNSAEEAHAAYLVAAAKLFGEFGRPD